MILDDELVKDEQQQKLVLSDKEIFSKIWFSPRIVFRFIEQNMYAKFGPVLLILAGISSALSRAASNGSGDTMSLWEVIAISIFFGGLLGWISYYIYAALLSWTGNWLKGQGDTKSLVRMLAHAAIPTIAGLVLIFAQIGVFGNSVFESYHFIDPTDLPLVAFYYLIASLEVVLGVWTMVLVIISISEVQKFSLGKAILNALLPIFVIAIPIALIAFIVGDLLR